jgi:hypothetical protein
MGAWPTTRAVSSSSRIVVLARPAAGHFRSRRRSPERSSAAHRGDAAAVSATRSEQSSTAEKPACATELARNRAGVITSPTTLHTARPIALPFASHRLRQSSIMDLAVVSESVVGSAALRAARSTGTAGRDRLGRCLGPQRVLGCARREPMSNQPVEGVLRNQMSRGGNRRVRVGWFGHQGQKAKDAVLGVLGRA